MKQHFCPAEQSMVAFENECNWCGELESQEPDVQETLHWYAFNYRQAHTAQAHEMWLELEQFVDRKMKAPQRTEQERDEILQAITDPENQPSQFGTVTLDFHFEKIKKWEDLFERMSDKLLAQRTEQNFCSRCGKRTKDLTTIHTCTPPQD
jgi:hypothetical protein